MSNLYGRSVRVTIRLAPNQKTANTNQIQSLVFESSLAQDNLRITFDVNYPGVKGWYFSEIVIYNMDAATEKTIIDSGAIAIVEAGYGAMEKSNPNFGCVFQGYVFQTLFERENVTDFKLTIRCIDGDRLFTDKNFIIGAPLKRGMDLTTKMNQILSRCLRTIPMADNYTPPDTPITYRGEVFHKSPAEAFNELYGWRGVDKESNYRIFSYNSVVQIIDDDSQEAPDYAGMITISPDNGLIGTPKQTQYGCDFTMLLNSNIILKRPHCVVKLDNISFSQMRADVMNSPIPNFEILPDYKIMMFQVIGVRHVGDTIGNIWYTYVTGCNLAGARPITETPPSQGVGNG